MIVQIKGVIVGMSAQTNSHDVDIETASGITYRLNMPSKDLQHDKGDEVTLYTSYQVREDSQNLYGFSTNENRNFFEKLISVSGIGPKIGLALLSMFSSTEITNYILAGDHKSLSKAPGIGPKGAKKIILELGGILSSQLDEEVEESLDDVIRDLGEALTTLGFKGDERRKMIDEGKKIVKSQPELTIEQLLQKVLRKE